MNTSKTASGSSTSGLTKTTGPEKDSSCGSDISNAGGENNQIKEAMTTETMMEEMMEETMEEMMEETMVGTMEESTTKRSNFEFSRQGFSHYKN